MAKETQETIHTAALTNNCPECFNQELQLVFFQKHRHTKLYHQTTAEVRHELKCRTCGSTLFPVSWTDDIERVVDFYVKKVQPERARIRYTTLFYVLILILIAIIGAGVYLFTQGTLDTLINNP